MSATSESLHHHHHYVPVPWLSKQNKTKDMEEINCLFFSAFSYVTP